MLRQLLTFLLLSLVYNSAVAQFAKEVGNKNLSISLSKKLQKINSEDSIDVYISFTTVDSLPGNFRTLSAYAAGKISSIRIKASQLVSLLQRGQVLFADEYNRPKEELTTGTLDLATNKSNLAHKAFPFITGEGILLSVKENRMDTADLDYIGRYINSGLSAGTSTPHASIMATTIAGVGNSSNFGKGVAYKSFITSSSFASLLPDADAVFRQYDITVQNHSYGTVIQNYYGLEAMAYDISSINNPALLHVFSSGNSGASKATTGAYSEIEGFANLTGNFKMAKNVLTVGAIDSFYNIAAASSKGPAYDGRIKPELVAFGEDGSSGAAAMVSGAAALVQQAYKLKYSKVPSAAITKAVLVNSASDVGVKGIDFSSGFGSLNTYAAVKTVQEGRLFENAIRSNEVKRFQIIVPSNAAQLKVTVTWLDPAATVNTPKALVNDLNLKILSPSNGQWLPWVLNSKPHKDSLQLPAERKVDTLNTIEQVTIERPEAGIYTIEVSAGSVINNEQFFSIAYQVDTLETLFWTFPSSIDPVKADASNVIRWETNKTGTAVIEYSTDKSVWKPVASLPDVSVGYYKWQVPDTTCMAWLRLQSGGVTITSDTFVISSIPRLDVGFNCTDSFLLFWNKEKALVQYQLYELKDKYLGPFAITNDTFSLLRKAQHPSVFYSVAPVIDGKPGFRSAILNYTAQGVDCYFKSFFLQSQDGGHASFFSSIGSTYGIHSIALEKLQGNKVSTLQTVIQPTATQFSFDDPSLQQGANQYRIALQASNGQMIYSELVTVYYFNNKDIIIYPNPATQQQPVHILTSRAGRTTIQVYNSNSVMINEIRLRDLLQQIPPLQLNRGLYFIKVIDEEKGTASSQKLIVY